MKNSFQCKSMYKRVKKADILKIRYPKMVRHLKKLYSGQLKLCLRHVFCRNYNSPITSCHRIDFKEWEHTLNGATKNKK